MQLTTLTPQKFREMSPRPVFDGLVTFSSVEHSGLGRYGDQLNPWGDLITMARAWCVLKPGARAIVGVPTAKDTLCYNTHKFYGRVMYPHLFANFVQVHSDVEDWSILSRDANCYNYDFQPIHVIEKPVP